MARPFYRSLAGCALLIGVFGGSAQAASWADGLFPQNRHDFGTVPRGVKVKHDFVMVNRLSEPVTILNMRPSCGCTSGKANVSVVAPGQSAVVEAEMDTRNFVGLKSTVLYVTLMTASGQEGEARLGVTSHILSDIVLNPGAIDFGTVTRGQAPKQVLTIDRINAPGWKFVRMLSASRVIDAQLVQTARTEASASYALTVSLKPEAPPGLVRDEIRLVSNDAETASIPIIVTAAIRGDLTASPSVLALGQIHSAAGAEGRFIVRASRPFTIRSIDGANDGFSISAANPSPLATHVVTVSYKPDEGTNRGDIRHTFHVTTDLPGEPPLELVATLRVNP